jgi:hypothetical protein
MRFEKPPQTIQRSRVRWPQRLYMVMNLVRGDEVLNSNSAVQSLPSENLATDLIRLAKRRESEFIVPGSFSVNYGALQKSNLFKKYQHAVSRLQTFDTNLLVDLPTMKVFWINLYNALIIHAVIVYQPKGRINGTRGLFDRAAYNINGLRYSANDIEHGILRKNAGHPLLPGPQFAPDDPRFSHVLAEFDLRIHYALNCAAKSCPPIHFYTPELLDEQLDIATRNFVNNGGIIIRRDLNTVYLSRIFSWYAADFGGRLFGYRSQDVLLQYVSQYLQSQEDQVYLVEFSKKLKVRFLTYDWSLNE